MKSMIIADDEVIERKVLEKKLKNYFEGECEIRSAANGQEAVELFEASPAEVVILDISMPGLNGLQAAEKIRSKSRSASIIFLTAYDDFQYAKKAISVRATDYLLKPCDDDELISSVEAGFLQEEKIKNLYDHELPASAAEQESSGSEDIHAEIQAYIEQNYMRDLSVPEMAERFRYAEPYFCRLFKQYFGSSFVSWLTDYRIKKAKLMLSETDMTISEIGKETGYPDSNYFTKVFRRKTGLTPSEYRRKVPKL